MYCGDCSCSVKYQKLTCPTILIVHACNAHRAHDDGRERDKHHDREKDRRSGRDRNAHEKKRRRSTSRDRPGRDGVKSRKADQSDPAVILANEERAKLGLKPLK